MEKMQVLEDNVNALMGRREVVVKIATEKETPSRETVMNLLHSHFTVPKDTIVIEKILHPFGTKFVKVEVRIYGRKEGASNEPAFKAKRGTKTEKKTEEKK
ncbi:hypothetical protein HY989_03230 [Candidatus Micrarchaeota archaeon]|nr:hypothetical protein [Candidatus Micrarchaeota archaeon]